MAGAFAGSADFFADGFSATEELVLLEEVLEVLALERRVLVVALLLLVPDARFVLVVVELLCAFDDDDEEDEDEVAGSSDAELSEESADALLLDDAESSAVSSAWADGPSRTTAASAAPSRSANLRNQGRRSTRAAVPPETERCRSGSASRTLSIRSVNQGPQVRPTWF